MNAHRQQDERRVAEGASEWLELLEEDAGPETRAAFAAWIAESPLHVREFLHIAAVDQLLANIDPGRVMQIESLNPQAPANVIGLHKRSTVEPPKVRDDATAPSKATSAWIGPRWQWSWAAGLAIVAVGVAILWSSLHSAGWREYATAVGEQSTVGLSDGTVMNLNTRSRVQVRFSGQAREVRLLDGEALFTVHHDPSRAFQVYAGSNVVRAIGTAFNVHRRPTGDTTVSVIEGKVQISSTDKSHAQGTRLSRLAAGEEARIAMDGRVEKHTGVDPATVTAWRERRLVFRRASLEAIAEEFNRYNETLRVRVQGNRLRTRLYTVVLPADDYESLVEYLRSNDAVEVVREGNEIEIRER